MDPTSGTATHHDGYSPQDAVARGLADAHDAWRQGQRERAVALLAALAESAPHAAAVRAQLGAYALESGHSDDARRWLAGAVALAPDNAAAWTNLGTARLRLGHAGEAVTAFRRALALDQSALAAHANLGSALQQQGDVDGAVVALEVARGIDPESPEVLNNLGNLYKEQGRLGDAMAAYHAASRAAPQFAPAASNLLAATKLSTGDSPGEIFALHRAFAARFEARWSSEYLPLANPPDPRRRLRIGYVSPDCHTALPAFVEPVLRHHDRNRFDVFVYFNNPQPPASLDRLGPITARVMKGATDGAVAQWIRDDQIDLLLDIAGHTGHNRLGVFGRRPAPVQLTWLDYLGTTGLDAIDYRITDAVSDPPGASEALHSETLLRIAPAQWCWNPPSVGTAPVPPPDTGSDVLTLGSFNQGAKLTDATLALWARVLAALPSARLVVVGVAAGSAQARVRAAFGADASRVLVHARLAPEAFRREAAAVHIALDPRPFSGATTTLEMLALGVPVVSWPGSTSASRSSASLLTALGLERWIASDADDYIAIVRRAAMDRAALALLRADLPHRLRTSALCDAPRFVRSLEQLLATAWGTWCERKSAPHAARPAPSPAAAAALRRIAGDERIVRVEAALRRSDIAAAVDGARALLGEFPEWQAAHRVYLQALLAWSRAQPALVARMFEPPPAMTVRPRISVLICSIDRTKFDAVVASYRLRFSGFPLEIVGVHDARSLAEGYNRAAARCNGDILVFSHDDIALETPDFAVRLAAHLERHDGVGVAGASRVTGPHWDGAGQRFVHGHVLHAPPRNTPGVLLSAAGFQHPVCSGIRVLDGVFIAVRRQVWEAHRFDSDTYDGFHLYDLDFTWRATGAGANLAVPLDIVIRHQSSGHYDAAWRRYARRFVAQAGLDPLAPRLPGGLQVRLDSAEQVDALRAALLHFRYGAPDHG
jgi:predicted O-linked N-acetylglucosamine transferase (SPINDLY family)